MKNLLQTHSVSWAQSVRLTLESEGVRAVVLDENAPGYMGFAGRVRVAVLDDGDLARAQHILSQIAPAVLQAPPSWKVQKRGLLLLAAGFVLFVVSLAVFKHDGPRPLGYAIMATSVAAFVVGFVFIAIGPRADRQGP